MDQLFDNVTTNASTTNTTTMAPAEVDSVVKAIGYSIAGVGGLTVILTLIILVLCAYKKHVAAKSAAGGNVYSQI